MFEFEECNVPFLPIGYCFQMTIPYEDKWSASYPDGFTKCKDFLQKVKKMTKTNRKNEYIKMNKFLKKHEPNYDEKRFKEYLMII